MPDDETAIGYAREWLRTAGLLPNNVDNGTVVSRSDETQRVIVQFIPLEPENLVAAYPSAVVTIGPGGEIIEASVRWPVIDRYDIYQLRDPKDAWAEVSSGEAFLDVQLPEGVADEQGVVKGRAQPIRRSRSGTRLPDYLAAINICNRSISLWDASFLKAAIRRIVSVHTSVPSPTAAHPSDRTRLLVTERRYLVLNGPNLNLLGTREPGIYGATSLARHRCWARGTRPRPPIRRLIVIALQSNHEGELVDAIQMHGPGSKAIIINPGALSHYSIALRDALTGVGTPAIEVHISNIHAREEFRHHSVISAIARGQVVGLGVDGYRLALDFCLKNFQ